MKENYCFHLSYIFEDDNIIVKKGPSEIRFKNYDIQFVTIRTKKISNLYCYFINFILLFLFIMLFLLASNTINVALIAIIMMLISFKTKKQYSLLIITNEKAINLDIDKDEIASATQFVANVSKNNNYK